MIRTPRVLGIILAGGKGERLHPLTAERSKPSVPFGGRFRIVDFVLSNFVNSGILGIHLLVQYKSQSLIDHLNAAWRLAPLVRDHFISVVPPQMRLGESWFKGTADAVVQNLNLIHDYNPDLVAIFGADHIYRIDIRQMIEFHLERKADVTVCARPVPADRASGFGIIEVDGEGRFVGFQEKPRKPKTMPGEPGMAFSSMGNYIFDAKLLIETLTADSQRESAHDFGKTILPALYPTRRVFAYDFRKNAIPGQRPTEEVAYWRDVGDLFSYWEANMDLLGEAPPLDLNNADWPIQGRGLTSGPARIVSGEIVDSMLGGGVVVKGARIRRSVISREVSIAEGAELDECVICDHVKVGAGAKLRRVIVDRWNDIAPGERIGVEGAPVNPAHTVDPSGIIVVGRGKTRALQ
ncbi:MAG: glucose-1-phosphate adenylyltransferase [Candidatus Brocadiae bacterium]|nr:glucose-1-phosphate adenylyltransferase [Candidatus Brocadiia bacterium]